MYELGRRIRKFREEKGMTRAQLAVATDISGAHMGRIEKGESRVTHEVLFNLARALDKTVSDLFGDATERISAYALIYVNDDADEQLIEKLSDLFCSMSHVTDSFPFKEEKKILVHLNRLLARQRAEVSGLVAVGLHKYQVPYLKVTVAVATRSAIRPVTTEFLALVVEYLRGRPARAGRSGRPEVVVGPEAHYVVGCDTGLVPPDLPGLVVGLEDRHPQARGIEPVDFRQQLPGPGDSFFFIVIAKREVPEHLEKGEMALGSTDKLDVGRADTLLHAPSYPGRWV